MRCFNPSWLAVFLCASWEKRAAHVHAAAHVLSLNAGAACRTDFSRIFASRSTTRPLLLLLLLSFAVLSLKPRVSNAFHGVGVASHPLSTGILLL